MKRRQLGAGGPEVGAVGLGCWSFAGSYGPTDETESHATLARALELGVDLLDDQRDLLDPAGLGGGGGHAARSRIRGSSTV